MVGKAKLMLITNPGSSSRKYALYRGAELVAALHFEFENKEVICTLKKADGTKKRLEKTFKELGETVGAIEGILKEEKLLGAGEKLDAILARVAAPGDYFSADHLVDENCLKQLEIAKKRAPLHVPVVAGEIDQLVKTFKGVPVLEISDSAFHAGRPEVAKYYAFDTEVAKEFNIKKYGFHGLSVGAIVEYMKKKGNLPEKLIVCHVGSGTSVTAVLNGHSVENSMGYSPLEGAMMSTRVGSMDAAAALALKKALKMEKDEELELYLNKKAGLLGVSGQSDDMREILDLRQQGDEKAELAFNLYIYRLQNSIGQMAAAMNGVDAIVFTATIGERSAPVRAAVAEKLGYLGFELSREKNEAEMPNRCTEIGVKGAKPLYVIRTDEFEEMVRRAEVVLGEK